MSIIWVGIGVDEQLQSVRERIAAVEERLALPNSNLTLPLHISLKMSFAVEEGSEGDVMDVLESYFSSLNPFQIPVKGPEYLGTIAWVRMQDNPTLNTIHDELNEMLYTRFGVGLHEYDRDYMFHTTLFMDQDAEKVRAGYEAMLGEPLPDTLLAERFLIGASETGALGSFRVVREIFVKSTP